MDSWAGGEMSVPTSFGVSQRRTHQRQVTGGCPGHSGSRVRQTTRLHDRTGDKITLDEIERIRF